MIPFIRKFKIRHRLIIVFLLISIVPVVIVGISSYANHSKSIREKLTAANSTSLSLINKNISFNIERYQYLMDRLYLHPMVQDALSNYSSYSAIEKENFVSSTTSLLNRELIFPLYLENVLIISKEGSVIYDYGYNHISEADLLTICDIVDSSAPEDYWLNIENTQNTEQIVYGRKVNNMYQLSEHIGYILLLINPKLFTQEIISEQSTESPTHLLLYEQNGNILFSSSASLYPCKDSLKALHSLFTGKSTAFLDYTIQNQSYSVTHMYNEDIHGYIALLIPYSYIDSELSSFFYQTVFVLCVMIIISLCLALFIYRSISQPIKMAVSLCRQIQKGNYDLRIPDTGNDELHFLTENINDMLKQLQIAMKKQEENMEKERQLELQVLQYQINPHFLFNTLSTFRWISMIHKIPVLSDMITSLSEILKSTLVDTEKYISLNEELSNLKHYITIQKVRYADKFDYVVSASEASLTCRIPKFILQPLVENCILHGIYDTGKIITISIDASIEREKLKIIITDDGKGFDSASTQFKENPNSHHIGVANITKRLQVIYGETFYFSLSGKPCLGTECILLLPVTLCTDTK